MDYQTKEQFEILTKAVIKKLNQAFGPLLGAISGNGPVMEPSARSFNKDIS